MSKLALNMIVKDDSEADILDRCLSSIASYVDGIFITITNKPDKRLKKVIKKYGGRISYFKWTKDFAEARNFAKKQIPQDYKYMMWLDADDVVVGAEHIPNIVKIMEEQGLTAVYFDYNYEIDPDTGKVNIVHPRERIILKDAYDWVGSLHETLIPNRKTENAYYKNVKINHYPLPSAEGKNMLRNLEILEATYKKEGDNHDPRTEFYLARQYFDMGRLKEAEKLFINYLKHSGWDEERALACNYLGLICVRDERVDEAEDYFLRAIKEKPDYPTWYVNLAYLKALQQKWDEATHFLRLFVAVPPPKNSAVYVPLDDELRYYRTLYLVAMGKRKIPEAIEAAEALTKRFPKSEEFKKLLERVVRLQELVEITKGVEKIVNELKLQKEEEKIANLLNSLPISVIDNAYVEKLRQKHLKPKVWGEDTIVYWAGKSFEEWTPDSLKTGLGGSETAIVHLAKEWVKMGYKVTVFGNTGPNEGVYDGVEYLNWYRFNRWDKFNTLIIWRAPWELDFPYSAKRIWLDLHDVPLVGDFTQDRLKRVDKIFVKSKYHRELLPHVPDDKFAIITNGVDKEFAKIKAKRNKYRLIYASSYDRGLEWILRWGWPIIKKELPKAELHIYYGWNLFDAVNRNNPERMAWKKEMIKLMNQSGVAEHGRIGHKDLLKEKAKSTIHYYPTDFEEIDCISVRESALVGCVPVMSHYAALKEKPYGIRIKGNPRTREFHEKVAKEIVRLIKTGEIEKCREEGKKLAKKETWDKIAEQWLKQW